MRVHYFKNHLKEHPMIIKDCFRTHSLILAAALVASLGFVNHAKAKTASYLIDLNGKTVTQLGTLGGNSSYASAINDAG
jgi:hypothetical protein